jgi:hypothetical protein
LPPIPSLNKWGTTQVVIASEAKQSPSRKEEIASSQKVLLAMTRVEQLPNGKYYRESDPIVHQSWPAFKSSKAELSRPYPHLAMGYAIVVISARLAWVVSSRECWTMIGTSERMRMA